MLPEGWTHERLSSLIAAVDAGVSVNGEDRPAEPGEVGVLKISAVTSGVFLPDENKAVRQDELPRARVSPKADRVLVSRSNTERLVGASVYVEKDHERLFLPDKLWQLEPSPTMRPHMRWLAYWLASPATRTSLSGLATGTSASMKNISIQSLLALEVSIPPRDEQERIALVLSTWDEAIAIAERLLSGTRRRNRSIAISLLSGKRRLHAHSTPWTYADLDQVFERVVRKNSIQNDNVLTISGEYGLISQREFFSKSVASADLSGYTLLHRGEFAYNKSYSAGYPMGAIKPLMTHEAGVVSSLYLCFRLRPDVDASFDYFRHYFEFGMLDEGITGIAQEGARNHGLLNVSIGDFFRLRIPIPSAEEQSAIATIINTGEAEERLQAERLHALRTEKQGLMRDLLTGKRRVRLPASEITP